MPLHSKIKNMSMMIIHFIHWALPIAMPYKHEQTLIVIPAISEAWAEIDTRRARTEAFFHISSFISLN
jgi:hypothetical protein